MKTTGDGGSSFTLTEAICGRRAAATGDEGRWRLMNNDVLIRGSGRFVPVAQCLLCASNSAARCITPQHSQHARL